jgi:hypothetical protein
MYYRYVDNITGEEVNNPFVDELVNEAKIKLRYRNKWYDLIIKNVKEDSMGFSYTYTASDLHIQELSKNGFGLTLDTSLENNMGTLGQLASTILSDTDWTVDASEIIPQTIEENLIETKLLNSIFATQLKNDLTVAPEEITG